jgi:hypothetical protein
MTSRRRLPGGAGTIHSRRAIRRTSSAPCVGPPFGITVMDLPLRVPLPAKISIQVLEPIDLRSELGASPDLGEGYELITSTMQRTLTDLSEERTLPVIG